MASFFNFFGRSGNKGNTPPPPKQNPFPGPPGSSPTAMQAPQYHQQSYSPSNSSQGNTYDNADTSSSSRKPPFFFREENSNLIAKGNFLTLAAKPEHVDLGEWLAHQVVEQYRLLEAMIKVIQEVDSKTGYPVCNPHTCPTMSAAEFTYTWLDRNTNPVRIPAQQYISLVQKWILGKINDDRLFPTSKDIILSSQNSQPSTPGTHTPIAAGPSTLDPAALSQRDWLGKVNGFPENFQKDIESLYRQMFRCYAHIYHGHWVDPFYHVGATKELNTCFIHFVTVGTLFGLLSEKDMKPMQPLIDIWISNGLIPTQSGPSRSTSSASASASQPGS